MKWKISLLLALVIGALAGSWIKNLSGLAIIVIDNTSYEMRLWVAVSLVLAVISLLFLGALLIHSIFSGGSKIQQWRSDRGWRKARKKTIQGMLAFAEGHWKQAESLMVDAAKSSDTQLINYLIAAQAAQYQSAEVRRDAYLRYAYQAEPAAKVAIGLTQAQLQLKQGQFEQALASLSELKEQNPTHRYVLKLLCRLYEKLNDWEQLLTLLAPLKKHAVFEPTELQQVEQNCVSGLLNREARNQNFESLRDKWIKLPSGLQKQQPNILSYCRWLVEFEQMDEAENLLRPLIKKSADADTLALYGNVVARDPGKQFQFLENWQQSNPSAPREVYLTLGKLALNAKLWGKARQFLEQALRVKPCAEAYLMMAKSLERLDGENRAALCYQQGLEFAATPKKRNQLLTLQKGSEDLIQADLLPKFQKLD